ncbi:hypothetical protein [Sphingobacterium haloxyli]|uniref:Uncharacterized protein n=1 Tax=Sphingobacterium haloxyli TaxID=2100533 RepID=A0A2S9J784_9SPHI|nr:hypothetical protein [Sphingobacterium haloxyli]PRD48658.1 hypothetical protein C5745_05525 [Sphingobacterium haloxyli]
MEEELKERYQHIIGWGIDANPLNEPTYPIKDEGVEKGEVSWERPEKQKVEVEVLYSNERPGLPAVVGETFPPQFISGRLRRYAFKYSESRYRHWLPLLIADRINELEGVVGDITKGRLPTVLAKREWKARWQHERKSLVRNVLIGALAGMVIFKLVKYRQP